MLVSNIIASIVSRVILLDVLLVLYCQHCKLCDTVNKGKKNIGYAFKNSYADEGRNSCA